MQTLVVPVPTQGLYMRRSARAKSLVNPPVPRLLAATASGTDPENCFFVKNATSEVLVASLASVQAQVGHVRLSAVEM